MKKSTIVAFILAVFLGPLGLLYSSVVGGIILIVLALLLGSVGEPLALLTWVIAAIWAPVAALGYNGRVDAQMRQAAEMAAAAVREQGGAAEPVEVAGAADGFAAALAVVEPYGERAVKELKTAYETVKDPDQLMRIARQIEGDFA